jgi:menaquinone-dependent protoporphyrinogen IX oxidase
MKKREFLKLGLLSFSAMTLTNKLSALEYYPNKSDKKWAVLYGTWCGSSRDAAIWISEGMDGIANVFDVREDPDLSGYDYIVVGGSIRAGKVSDLLQDYLEKQREKISDKIHGLFAVCGNRMQPVGPEQTTNLIDNHLAKLCDVNNIVPSKVFLGRITYGLLDEESREMIRGFNMPEYDNLKREECLAFGREILSTKKQL